MSRTAAPPTAPRPDEFLVTQRHRGACTDETAALFFDDGRQSGHSIKTRQEAAKAICRLCPVLLGCRAYARADPTLEGIWGGETEAERQAARRRTTRGPSPMGENEQGRRLAAVAAQRAQRDGLDAAARALNIPPTTLRRVLALYGLDQPPTPLAHRTPERR
jgi:WhiB family redox-sensing transcriptional regulator